MNTEALRAEITANPAKSDAEMVAHLRAVSTVWIDTTAAAVESVCRMAGIISRLDDLVEANPAPSMARTVAKEFLGIITGKIASIEMSNAGKRASILAMLGALQAVGWLSADEVTAILAIAKAERTRAAVIGCDVIEQMDDASAALTVAAARA